MLQRLRKQKNAIDDLTMQPTAIKSMQSIATTFVVMSVFSCIVPRTLAQEFVLDDNQFDQWVFNGMGGSPDASTETSLMIEAIDRACHLNKAQQEQLRLAGVGDFARFKQQVDDVRHKYAGKTYDQNEIGNIYQKIQPLTARCQAGLLGEGSLFSKVLRHTLTPEQLEEYEATDAERRKARHAAKIKLFVALFERSCPLKSTQRDALVDLLLAETKPAKRASEYDWYVVLVQTAKIPDDKFKAFLDEAQMRQLKKSTQQARGYEQMLKRQGILDK